VVSGEEHEAGSAREVVGLAWPLAVGMLSFTCMGLVDTLLMGRVGTEALAGVGLGASLLWACQAFFRGLTSGAQALVAAADGAGDRERRSRAAGAGLLLGVGSGVLLALVLAPTHEALVAWVVVEPAVAERCMGYLGVRLWGLPFTLVSFGCLAALQGVGDTRARMWVSLAGNVLNVVLSPCLVFGLGPLPALAEVGAALATVASVVLMAACYAARAVRVLGWPRWPGGEVLRGTVRVGAPTGAQLLLGVGAFTLMNVVLARVGAAHLAASQVVLQVVSVSFLPGLGLGEAGGVLVGRYLGAGQRAAAVRSLRSARLLAVAVMSAFGVLFACGGEGLAGWFSRDPEVTRLAGLLMLFAASFQLFDAVATVHLCALRGAGDTRFTLVATSLSAWGLTVPATCVLGLGLGWGATGAWLGLTLQVAAVAAATGWRVRGLERGTVGRLDLLLGSAARRRPSGRRRLVGASSAR
jgi:MATE family multidrug resistance protein